MSKQAGRMSQSANDFLAPLAPTIGTATNVGTNRPYNNGAVSVTFTANAAGATATSYTASGYCSVHGTTHTATGSSSPIVVTGFGVGTTPTITVTATNLSGTSAASSASNSVTVTTVPATMSAPGVSSPTPGAGVNEAGASYDTVTWSAPANGGSAITGYTIAGSDGSSSAPGPDATSVNITQTGTQAYTIYATNANGSGAASPASASVTTFAFSPFSVFSFSPFNVFGFSPFNVFGFSPFNVFGFSPFNVFGFSPFSVFSFSPFSVFGFSPFGVFGFSPFGAFGVFGFSPFGAFGVFGFSPFGAFGVFGFSPFGAAFSVFGFSPFGFYGGSRAYSLAQETRVRMADGTLKEAQDIEPGDELLSIDIPGLINTDRQSILEWLGTGDLSLAPNATTTVTSLTTHPTTNLISINGDKFTQSHLVLIKKDGIEKFVVSDQIVESDLVWSYESSTFVPITQYEITESVVNSVTINCEPFDIYFTENHITHDGINGEPS